MTEPRAMTGRVTLGNGEVRDLASPGKRLVARIIDIAIITVVAAFLAIVGFAGAVLGSETDEDALALTAIFAGFAGLALFSIIALVYEPTLIALRGQTLGKMAMSIVVVRAEDGEVPGWGKAIGRWILPGLLSLIPVAGGLLALLVYLSLLWDDRRQGWHDKMGTTVVIDV
ncbi:MAG: RDD family protein [bacterium]|nr:RDD family protein [bacterium]MDE0501969.1 RDD family protein [bacterium]